MYKKILVVCLSMLMLAGCSNSNPDDESTAETSATAAEAVTEAVTSETTNETTAEATAEETEEEIFEEPSAEIVDYCVLTKEAVEAAHPEIEGRTEEEIRDLLSVLTDEELKTLCPTDEDLAVFIQMSRGREGNMFRDVTLDSIAKAASDNSTYYNADCDIVFDYEDNEGTPVAVYYSKPKFLVYDWTLLVADAFGYDSEQIKAFCDSDDYEVIKTADVTKAREILTAHGGEPADWA